MLDFNPPAATRVADPVAAFAEEIQKAGLPTPEIIPDGKLHRFDIKRRGDNAGWYVLHLDGIAAGIFGNWQTDEKRTWSSKSRAEMTDLERDRLNRQIEAMKAARAEARQREWEAARDKLKPYFGSAGPASPDHPYLERKKVKPYGDIRQANDLLLVPMCDVGGEFWAYQEIYPEKRPFGHGGKPRDKSFPKGAKKSGNFFTIPGNDQIYICEGYATAASIHEATGATVIVSFDAGNLLSVAKAIRAKYPDAKIVIAGDSDETGRAKAKAAGEAIGARIVLPEFRDTKGKPTDFNDLAAREGLDAVKKQIAAGGSAGLPSLNPGECRVAGWLKSRPPEREILIHADGQPFLPRRVVGGVAATGGTGKTYALLQMIDAATSDREFKPFSGKFGALLLSGEDDQSEIARRLWDISDGGPFGFGLFVKALPGEIGPLMELRDGNPARSKWFEWLDHELVEYEGLIDLLVLDPMSRFFGLEENRNEHGTAFIAALESIAQKHDLTILFATHTNEASQEKPPARMNKTMLRGGSALSDACRLIIGMRTMTQTNADRFGIENRKSYVELDLIKTNYTAQLKSPLFFKHNSFGFKHVRPEHARLKAIARGLVAALIEDGGEYTARQLERGGEAKAVVDYIAEAVDKFERRKDIRPAIDFAMFRNWIKTERTPVGKTCQMAEIIRVVSSDDCSMSGFNQTNLFNNSGEK